MGQLENYAEPEDAEDAGASRPRGAAVVVAQIGAWLRGAGRTLRGIDANELLIVTSLLLLCVLIKVLWLRPVDMYWDAGAKWHFVRQWAYANEFGDAHWSHHMARFGVNLPTYVVQLLFGTSSRAYYITPIAIFALGTLFVYLTASRLGGRAAGVVGALIMILHPDLTRGATQLLPDGMAGTAAIIAAYAFVRFHEADGAARLRWLLGIALACIWAYSIKESSVLLFPGVGLAVFLSRRSFKEAAIVAGVIALFGVLESLGFWLLTPYAHRLAVVQEEHGLYPPVTFFGMFGRFFKLEQGVQVLFWLWLASVLHDAGSSDKRRRLLLLLPLGYVFCLTFMVRRFDPLSQWLSFKPRYMWPALPLLVASVAVFATECVRRAWALQPRLRFEQLRVGLERQGAWALCALCVALGAGVYMSERKDFDTHPLVTLPRDASILNDAFRRNLPIIERGDNPRGLNTMYAVYMKPAYLAQSNLAQGGRLPDIQEAVRFFGKGKKRRAYVLRDDSQYQGDELHRLIAEDCALSVSVRHGLRISPSEKLPDCCKAPRGEPLPKVSGRTGLF